VRECAVSFAHDIVFGSESVNFSPAATPRRVRTMESLDVVILWIRQEASSTLGTKRIGKTRRVDGTASRAGLDSKVGADSCTVWRLSMHQSQEHSGSLCSWAVMTNPVVPQVYVGLIRRRLQSG